MRYCFNRTMDISKFKSYLSAVLGVIEIQGKMKHNNVNICLCKAHCPDILILLQNFSSFEFFTGKFLLGYLPRSLQTLNEVYFNLNIFCPSLLNTRTNFDQFSNMIQLSRPPHHSIYHRYNFFLIFYFDQNNMRYKLTMTFVDDLNIIQRETFDIRFRIRFVIVF